MNRVGQVWELELGRTKGTYLVVSVEESVSMLNLLDLEMGGTCVVPAGELDDAENLKKLVVKSRGTWTRIA